MPGVAGEGREGGAGERAWGVEAREEGERCGRAPPGKAKAAEPPRRRGTWPIAAPARCPQVTRGPLAHCRLLLSSCSSPRLGQWRPLPGRGSVPPPSTTRRQILLARRCRGRAGFDRFLLFLLLFPSLVLQRLPLLFLLLRLRLHHPRHLRSAPRSHRCLINRDKGSVSPLPYYLGELLSGRFETRQPVGPPGMVLEYLSYQAHLAQAYIYILRLAMSAQLPRPVYHLDCNPCKATPSCDTRNTPLPHDLRFFSLDSTLYIPCLTVILTIYIRTGSQLLAVRRLLRSMVDWCEILVP